MTKETSFKAQLRNNIRDYISAAKKDGVVNMSARNLMQCVKPPSGGLEGAPKGTNARWTYANLFADVCREPAFKRFVEWVDTAK